MTKLRYLIISLILITLQSCVNLAKYSSKLSGKDIKNITLVNVKSSIKTIVYGDNLEFFPYLQDTVVSSIKLAILNVVPKTIKINELDLSKSDILTYSDEE